MPVKNCEICGEKFTVAQFKLDDGFGRFCSRKCMGVGLGKEREGILTSVHVEYICKQCGTKFTKSPGITNVKFCSLQCGNAYKSEHNKKPDVIKKCKLCPKTFVIKGRFASRVNHKKFCSRRCAAIYGVIHSKKKNTGIEIKLAKVLDDLKIPYKTQEHINRITVPDFIVEPNIAIYSDGQYWHNLPKAKVRDAKINNKLAKLGYKVIRFWENDINNNIDLITTTLRREILHAIEIP